MKITISQLRAAISEAIVGVDPHTLRMKSLAAAAIKDLASGGTPADVYSWLAAETEQPDGTNRVAHVVAYMKKTDAGAAAELSAVTPPSPARTHVTPWQGASGRSSTKMYESAHYAQGSAEMKITISQLRKIIAEEVRRVAEGDAVASATAELQDTAGDWVEDNYDAILAKLQSNPKLVDAILAAAGVNESYAGDLARGVGNYYKDAGDIAKHGGSLMGTAGGYLGAAVMAIVNDPSLIPWTELRELQLDDKIVMDGTALKGAVVGALLGHLVDVARHAKKFADRKAAFSGRATRR